MKTIQLCFEAKRLRCFEVSTSNVHPQEGKQDDCVALLHGLVGQRQEGETLAPKVKCFNPLPPWLFLRELSR